MTLPGVEKVSVAIVSWNGRQHLESCLEALERQRDPGVKWDVLVLDNGSRDGTGDWLAQHKPGVRLIRSPVNLGFCRGNNRLVELADGDAVALLNNDARPHEDWLAALVEALASAPADVGAVSGRILDWEGERLDFAQGILTFDGHAFQLGYHTPLQQVELPATGSELLFPCGGNMLVRRRSFLEAGGFDSDYFAYLEDVDLGWRLWAGGERVSYVNDAVAYHRSMATSELLGHFNRGFLFERNAFLTAYKNYEEELWQRMMPAVLLTLLSRTQTMLIENNPGGLALEIDPYAGAIADTAPAGGAGRGNAAGLSEKWRQYGLRGVLRRTRDRLGRLLLAGLGHSDLPVVRDGRSISQFRALSYLLRHLETAAGKRQAVQRRRRRPDREIFERFPLYLIPTYPGDDELFSSTAFTDWLPSEPQLVRRQLNEVMNLE